MIGGMVGNNACGARSVIYGSTREHLLEVTAILADGTKAVFKDLTHEEFLNLEKKIIHFEFEDAESLLLQLANTLNIRVKGKTDE